MKSVNIIAYCLLIFWNVVLFFNTITMETTKLNERSINFSTVMYLIVLLLLIALVIVYYKKQLFAKWWPFLIAVIIAALIKVAEFISLQLIAVS